METGGDCSLQPDDGGAPPPLHHVRDGGALLSPLLGLKSPGLKLLCKSAGCCCSSTYVLWDLDVGEGVLGGLRWQGPDAIGGGDGGQAGGRHHFSLNAEEKRRKEQKSAEIRPGSTPSFQSNPWEKSGLPPDTWTS